MSPLLISRRPGALALASFVVAAMLMTPNGSASRLPSNLTMRSARISAKLSAAPHALSTLVEKTSEKAGVLSRDAATTAGAVLTMVSSTASQTSLSEQAVMSPNEPLSQEAIRLWMSSYNAGPYATLRYKGQVPYKETRNYAPRVMKYYQQDLSDNPYEAYIVKAANKYWLDPQLIRAVIKTESDFRPRLKSHAGARGLMQVMPVVWSEIRERYDLKWNYHDDVWDPEKNVEVACAYLAWLRYDFLPKHFTAFETDLLTPPALIRHTKLQASVPRIDTGGIAATLPNPTDPRPATERAVAQASENIEGLGEAVHKAIEKVMTEAESGAKKSDRRMAQRVTKKKSSGSR